ncbi:hypothetical protein NEF87_001023 [Candidatus Lokiarchaeum ossiferum]|uniref:NADPH-dependent FMN reductase-like domain-containing protein n=1 Tax=Candidatus Lokiarchaeum ossiferum TaxID=2951803 RepID=A0ABY6HMK3_9ARCH|nr:hypothetical protein NEF87_001023 [Candidatus Lokiarchaeum sp. B-35]
MKIISIFGSPRKKYSYEYTSLVKKIMDEERNSIEYQDIFLQKILQDNCNGCYQCMKKGEKFCKDYQKINPIIQSLDNADGLIISCPVYVDNVSGLMKNFIDHLAYLLHRPRFFGKKAIIIVSTLETGIKSVSHYLSKTVSQWGFDVVGTIGIKVKGFEQNEIKRSKYMKKIKKLSLIFLQSIIQNKKHSPKLENLIFFHLFKVLVNHTRDLSPEDYNYWEKKGWFEKNYFYKIYLNPITLTMAKFVAFLVKIRIAKNEKRKMK